MTHKHKGLSYTLKNLDSKGKAGKALRMQVLRCVLAVGFALSPWLGGEAFADPGIVRVDGVPDNVQKTYLTGSDGNVAHIYAEQAYNGVGLNRFQTFKVENGEIANLYFKTGPNGSSLNALVNTVETQIRISGVVNGIRNNTIGGKLYFLSPNGMVVGSKGVINAGALTVVAPASLSGITNAEAAAANVVNNSNWGVLAIDDYNDPVKITINGKINTATGIDLQAVAVDIKKAVGSSISPTLLTGVMFQGSVNTGFEALPISNTNRLQLKKDESGKIILDTDGDVIVADPSNTQYGDLLEGKGKINIYSYRGMGEAGIWGTTSFNEAVLDAIGNVAIECGSIIEIDKPIADTTNSTASKTSITAGNRIKFITETGDIYNNGTVKGNGTVDFSAGNQRGVSNTANIINYGTIQSTNGGMSLAADRLLTNTGTIKADDQITFTVGGTLTNEGEIKSTSSNVQAHVGRNFYNVGGANSESSKRGLIEAGGNVQIDYTLPDTMSVATPEPEEEETPLGIYNSGTIKTTGIATPSTGEESTSGNNSGSGSGNIWLTSSYNIENTATGKMIANRQITLNARDFLHNYGLIEGVTYLDIKSIMGYVYNHTSGVIRAKGGNIDLSSGQANLQIDGDDGTKKELYRKFTPVIIEGKVEATSDDDESNQTKEGNIKITAYLGDIYINGGTIETNPKKSTSGEVNAVAGNVILDAAQNITIGFETESAKADDPTTDGVNKDNPTEREYYKPLKETSGNLVSGNAAQISSTNITLTSGSGATNTISISAVNNALTASDSIKLTGGGNVTIGAGASVKADNDIALTSSNADVKADQITLGGSLKLQGNNITVAGVQRSGNPSGSLQVVANGVGGTDSAINSLNLNIAGDVLFNTLNVNTADVNVSGDLQIKQLHVVDQAHFTSNNTVIGVYGEATEPRGDQSDALYRDMGDGNSSWMSISMDSKGYEIKNGSEIKSVLGDGTEDPVQMSSKLVDVDPQETLVENYGDATGNFGRFDLVDDSARPSGGIESTDQGSQTVLRQDENGLHIETSDNKVDNGPQIEASDNKADQGSQIDAGDDKVDNGPQIEAGDNKVDQGSQIEAGDDKVDNGSQIEAGDDKGDQDSQIEANDDKDDNGSKIEAGDDKEDEDSQLEAGDKKKDKSKRDKKDKREKKKKDK